MDILLLCNRPVKNADASTVTDHLDAFSNFSKHNIFYLSFIKKLPKRLLLDRFDVIIIHYSIALGYFSEHFLDRPSKDRITKYKGLKVVFIQDEYREINAVIEALASMKIDVLFTNLPNEEIEKVYPLTKLSGLGIYNNLTGYVPERLVSRKVPKINKRPVDVGYRARKLPFWLGELGYEKWQIAVRFINHASNTDLKLDISYKESDRIYGDRWIEFIASCKVVLGVESGASVFDFSGNIQKTVERYQAEHPRAEFYEVQKKFLLPYEGKILLNQISPRCFEAAALRTALLLYEGEYSGILEPWQHYVPLKKDFSNIADVLKILKDTNKLQKIADTAYQEIALNPRYSYRTFITNFDNIIEREMLKREKEKIAMPYSKSEYFFSLALNPGFVLIRLKTIMLQRLILGTRIRKFIFKIWKTFPLDLRLTIRPFLKLIGR